MANGSPPNVGFGDLLHRDRGLNAGFNTSPLKGILEGEGIHHGRQHAHIIGRGPIHTSRCRFT